MSVAAGEVVLVAIIMAKRMALQAGLAGSGAMILSI